MAAEMIAGRIERDKAHFRQVFARRGVDWDRVAIKFDFAAYISQYYNAVEGNCPMPRRGLFLIGPTGIGKTFLLRKFAQFFRLKFITSAELAEMAKYDGLDILRRFLTLPFSSWGRGDCDLIIDEIAEYEKHEVINYGQRCNVAEEFILRRYEVFERQHGLTFFTSNLPIKVFREQYGERLYSRIREMCLVVAGNGPDLRLLK